LLLAPTAESRPVGPGVVILAERLGDSRAQAAALACCTIALNLTALGLTRARRGPCPGRFSVTPDLI
jgi:hypothetical protein